LPLRRPAVPAVGLPVAGDEQVAPSTDPRQPDEGSSGGLGTSAAQPCRRGVVTGVLVDPALGGHTMRKLRAGLALRWQLPRLLGHGDGFNRMLGHAVRLQLGKITDDQFREELDRFYATLDREALLEGIDFKAKAEQLSRPGGYKSTILGLRENGA